MIVGTIRPQEARVFDTFADYHKFHAEDTQEPYGSFEVFWHEPHINEGDDPPMDRAGWFWWSCSPGCLPDGDANGPFASSRDALRDADEWHPEFN